MVDSGPTEREEGKLAKKPARGSQLARGSRPSPRLLLSSISEIIFLFAGETFMEETPTTSGAGSRRNEDIALDLMRFIAMTTGYGRTSSTGVGFQGTGSASKPEDYASHLLELYGKCLQTVQAKK